MKLKGVQIVGPQTMALVIPRANLKEDLVFTLTAILDETVFEQLCPEPIPPHIRKAGETITRPDFTDKKYHDAVQTWAEQKTAWSVITTLKSTEGLEWETVDLNDPTTWCNWKTELAAAGFTNSERAMIVNKVAEVNGLSQHRIDEAMQRFLAGAQETVANESTLQDAALTMQSGEDANDSA